MGSHSLPLSENEAHLLPVLPLIYVAWADGELGPDEIIAIRSAAGAMDDVSPGASALLERWLDPDHPPSADELQRIRLRTRQALAASQERPTSVSDAGMTLARSAEPSIAQAWDTPSGAQALKRLREAAGVFGRTGLGDFLVPVPSPLQVDSESPFSVLEMTSVLEASYSEERAQIRAWIAQQTPSATDLEGPEYREQVLRWASDLASRGLGDLALGAANDSRTPDLGRFVAAFETLGLFDLSLMVKCGVQFGLFGGSILHLGTEAHHQRYLPRVSSLELPGCFAMTELGHGSNVRDLETTATFDPERDGFVIHSPCDSARKEWIGNAAVHGQMATVFAQLLVGDDGFGVHAFLVPIRDENGAACEGVEIRDSGHKLGLNGVDNGQLMFDRVFVPRENLLDRFASVSQDGVYHSPIASPGKRFFTMLGTLVGGRVSVAAAAVSVSKVALTIALRYATRRRQFGPEGGPEVSLIDYPSHQRRLIPRLAETYALNFAAHDLADAYASA
ncbi:MAG: acyl-CoA dehydrogenase family protein, partial [Myxococcota bacterium]